jgi:thiopeptide-type bacteriocin biosynthesis protein
MFGKEEEKGALKDEVNETKFLLYRRFIECINNNGTVIHLKKEDFKDIESNSVDRLAQTGQIIFHYVDKDKDTLCLTTIGNSCGANLIARFAYGKEEIEGLYHQVTDFETAASDNAITAEIVHLPEHRIGNLSFRPASREYEIPIVNHSVLDDEHQVNLEDLYVTVQGNTIRLLSKKHGKYVFPKLTNAHNYSRNTLPIYQFLSELSYQHLIPSLSLRRGIIGYMQKIIPRIQYENVILAKATWRLEYGDFQSLIDKKDGLTLADLEAFREKWQLPIFTDYKYGAEAKSILIKWDNLISVHHFLSKLKDDGHALYLTEFPYDAESGVYTNVEGNTFHTQVIAVFKNHAKKPQRYFGIPKIYGEEDKQRNFFPADDWLYFKIYSGNQTYNKLMSEVIQPLVHKLYEQNLIEKCFYLPFTDPNFHLRIRFKASGEQRGKALEFISDQINQSIYAGLIDRIQLDTYKRELERYGNETMDIAESVFSLDSRFIINNHQWLIEGHNYQLPFLVMKQIDTIIDAFGQDFEFKFKLMEAIKESYLNEFGVGKKSDLKKILDKKLLDTRKEIEQIMVGQIDFLSEDQLNYYEASLQNYGTQLKTIYDANEAVLNRPDFLFRWLRSILHMHCIRCFFDRPRQNELFVYNGLFNYYRKLYFTSKKAKSKKAVAK